MQRLEEGLDPVNPPDTHEPASDSLDVGRHTHRHGSIVEFVYETLRQAITQGTILPGSRITENAVATELKVSRTPVREAIRLLESERLVERLPRIGIVAVDLDPNQLDDIYTTRSVLHGLAARLAAVRILPRELVTLRALQDEMDTQTPGTTSLSTMAAVNARFHDDIIRAARSESLTKLLREVEGTLVRFRHTTVGYPGRAEQSNAEHWRIIEALEQRDEVEAERLAREHVMNALYVRLKQDAESEVARFSLALEGK